MLATRNHEENPIDKVIGLNIKRILEEKGITKTSLFDNTNFKRYEELIQGKTSIKSTKIQEVAMFLGVETFELLDGIFVKDTENKESGASE